MTDLADVATLPAGWASDLRVNQAKPLIYKYII